MVGQISSMTIFLSTKEAPHDIRSNNINPSQKLPKLETSLAGEPNFNSPAKISHFMQGECCIGVERKCFLQLRTLQE